MKALYHGTIVRIVGYNASGTKARIVWRGMQRRVNARDLVLLETRERDEA